VLTSAEQAQNAVNKGACVIQHDDKASIQFIAVGAYQLQSCLRAAKRLNERKITCSVIAIIEPAKFRIGRDQREANYVHTTQQIEQIIPAVNKRIIVSHTHEDVITGVLRPLDTGNQNTVIHGYRNRGGTLDVFGMQYANQQTWAHLINSTANLLSIAKNELLTETELNALLGTGEFSCLR
jgi:phosphoketolase